ncbi:uncharacterized protein [Zea mays]|uniref:uncharacterized protein n=1 Tax=Zea mays TaxID=4577 RepID=UPI0009A9DDE7|nr:uncharacterized protein LOC109941045 [Zea mays]|eukprot:XP_020397105.1 uncharacterized protein LOC109941045 [Zea mays]
MTWIEAAAARLRRRARSRPRPPLPTTPPPVAPAGVPDPSTARPLAVFSHSSSPLNGGGSLSDSPPVTPEIDNAKHRDLHFEAAAQELDDVLVVDLGEDEHLLAELLLLLAGHRRDEPFNRDNTAVLEQAPVDGAEATVAEDVLVSQVVGRLDELCFCEDDEGLVAHFPYQDGRYTMFANGIDSSQVRVQRGGSSRSATRSSHRSTQDPAEVEQLREELRRHQDYLKQQAAQHKYYTTQIQQQQTLIQQLAQVQGIHVPVPPPPPPPLVHYPWSSPPPTPISPSTEHQTPPATLPTHEREDGLDFVETLFASGGIDHHSSL